MTDKYVVVGAGLFGSVFAYEASKRGYNVEVIEKRNHVGGNIYTEDIEGIQVHKYGAHIFHTKMENVWDYINKFAKFNNYVNSPIANYKGEIYNLPFNMNTFNKLWGVITPDEAQKKIEEQRNKIYFEEKPRNLEEQAISLVGTDIYEKLIKGYTEKQWGKPASELPSFIIRRIPVRFTYNNNYFNDPFQGIPVGGYTGIINCMLKSDLINVKTGTDFLINMKSKISEDTKVIFTGMIDQFFDYRLGALEYRSLKFDTEVLNMNDYQGNAVVNYTDSETPYTRVIEHKHFDLKNNSSNGKTVITHEYPSEWHRGDDPYYPINDKKNKILYSRYVELAQKEAPNVIFGGRLGQYRYYNMDQTIMAALQVVKREFGE
ncbi:UDP-galactopyranose mutase [Levilactobacillus spicheri]|uniref:UDP-galactopyranose mutase n=1 Tax=Levilactobacillus spicheri TaxID=216463 RepID=A0A0F3RS84_9LACO|nr:UDP-galactopyranose mutase [Levilactobacillus spicheri]KJW11652.1 UDP-galactopyranose mutase [Levilactobacillus spicheri]